MGCGPDGGPTPMGQQMEAIMLNKALEEYLRREKEDMKTMRGADHAAIIEEVAHQNGVTVAELTDEVLRHGVAR